MGELTGLRISLEARTPGAGEDGGSSHEVGRLGAAALGSASMGDRSLGLLEGGFRVCVREAPGALPLPSRVHLPQTKPGTALFAGVTFTR